VLIQAVDKLILLTYRDFAWRRLDACRNLKFAFCPGWLRWTLSIEGSMVALDLLYSHYTCRVLNIFAPTSAQCFWTRNMAVFRLTWQYFKGYFLLLKSYPVHIPVVSRGGRAILPKSKWCVGQKTLENRDDDLLREYHHIQRNNVWRALNNGIMLPLHVISHGFRLKQWRKYSIKIALVAYV